MIRLLIEEFALRIHEIFGADDVGMLDSRNHVAVLEAAVEYGNGHPPAFMSDIVKALSEQHLYLLLAVAVGLSLHTVPRVEGVVSLSLYQA